MIYRALLKNLTRKITNDEAHFLGEELLAYALLTEEGVIYKGEQVIRNLWGKPYLKNQPDIYYNISHSENCAACIISDICDVGIDVEKIRSFNMYAAQKTCSPEELMRIRSTQDANREFFRYWTLKESYIKAIGRGLSYPMKKVNFEIHPNGEIRSNISKCRFLLMEDTDGFITAVCYTGVNGRD